MTFSHQCLECGISFMTTGSWNAHLASAHERDHERFSEKNVLVHYYKPVLRDIGNNDQILNEYHLDISTIKKEVDIELENGEDIELEHFEDTELEHLDLESVEVQRNSSDVDKGDESEEIYCDNVASRVKSKRRKASKSSKVVKKRTCKFYDCQICQTRYSKRADLLEHMSRAHDDEGLLKCDLCDKTFLRQINLNLHARVHSKDKSYKCDLCDKRFRSRWQVKSHLKSHSKMHTCSKCDKTFRGLQALKEHAQSHKGEKRHECPVCLKRFSHRYSLKIHMLYHTGQNAHKCDTCGRCFPHEKRLAQHVALVHCSEVDSHECQICHRKCANLLYLNKHMKRMHAEVKPYQCDSCGKTFARELQLKIHQRSHQASSYQCSVCGNLYKQNGHLLRHMRKSHPHFAPPPNPFQKRKISLPETKCSECSLVFNGATALREHMVVHTDRPYACSQCPKKFKRPMDLTNHESIHLGKNKFACSICEDSFTARTSLNQHMKDTHDMKAFKCPHCPKSFKTSNILTNHVRVHTGEKPFMCDVCSKRFTQPIHMTRHKKLMHGIDQLNKRPYKRHAKQGLD